MKFHIAALYILLGTSVIIASSDLTKNQEVNGYPDSRIENLRTLYGVRNRERLQQSPLIWRPYFNSISQSNQDQTYRSGMQLFPLILYNRNSGYLPGQRGFGSGFASQYSQMSPLFLQHPLLSFMQNTMRRPVNWIMLSDYDQNKETQEQFSSDNGSNEELTEPSNLQSSTSNGQTNPDSANVSTEDENIFSPVNNKDSATTPDDNSEETEEDPSKNDDSPSTLLEQESTPYNSALGYADMNVLTSKDENLFGPVKQDKIPSKVSEEEPESDNNASVYADVVEVTSEEALPGPLKTDDLPPRVPEEELEINDLVDADVDVLASEEEGLPEPVKKDDMSHKVVQDVSEIEEHPCPENEDDLPPKLSIGKPEPGTEGTIDSGKKDDLPLRVSEDKAEPEGVKRPGPGRKDDLPTRVLEEEEGPEGVEHTGPGRKDDLPPRGLEEGKKPEGIERPGPGRKDDLPPRDSEEAETEGVRKPGPGIKDDFPSRDLEEEAEPEGVEHPGPGRIDDLPPRGFEEGKNPEEVERPGPGRKDDLPSRISEEEAEAEGVKRPGPGKKDDLPSRGLEEEESEGEGLPDPGKKDDLPPRVSEEEAEPGEVGRYNPERKHDLPPRFLEEKTQTDGGGHLDPGISDGKHLKLVQEEEKPVEEDFLPENDPQKETKPENHGLLNANKDVFRAEVDALNLNLGGDGLKLHANEKGITSLLTSNLDLVKSETSKLLNQERKLKHSLRLKLKDLPKDYQKTKSNKQGLLNSNNDVFKAKHDALNVNLGSSDGLTLNANEKGIMSLLNSNLDLVKSEVGSLLNSGSNTRSKKSQKSLDAKLKHLQNTGMIRNYYSNNRLVRQVSANDLTLETNLLDNTEHKNKHVIKHFKGIKYLVKREDKGVSSNNGFDDDVNDKKSFDRVVKKQSNEGGSIKLNIDTELVNKKQVGSLDIPHTGTIALDFARASAGSIFLRYNTGIWVIIQVFVIRFLRQV